VADAQVEDGQVADAFRRWECSRRHQPSRRAVRRRATVGLTTGATPEGVAYFRDGFSRRPLETHPGATR